MHTRFWLVMHVVLVAMLAGCSGLTDGLVQVINGPKREQPLSFDYSAITVSAPKDGTVEMKGGNDAVYAVKLGLESYLPATLKVYTQSVSKTFLTSAAGSFSVQIGDLTHPVKVGDILWLSAGDLAPTYTFKVKSPDQ